MKRNRFIGLLLLSFLMCVGMAMSASYGVTSPTSNQLVRDSAFNVTFNTTCSCNYTNYTLVVTGTLANTSKNYVNISNTTTSQSNISFYWNASGLEDSNDYVLSVIASNFSGSETSATTTGVIVDFTRPTVPSSLTSGRQTSSSVTLTATVDNPTTTSCSVSFQGQLPTSSVPTCSYSASTATVTLTNANEGSFGYQITASDETNSTPSAVTYFNVDVGRGGGKAPAHAQAQAVSGQDVAEQAKQIGGTVGKGLRATIESFKSWLRSLFA